MPLETNIEKASYEELRRILEWVVGRGGKQGRTPCVLVGGWAVYTYNPYIGSVDIDLVLNARTRGRLFHWLRKERAFELWRSPERTWKGVRKRTKGGFWIHVDTASRAEIYPFEGRTETLNFDIVDGHTETRRVDSLPVPVPERALLVLFKLKAAFDRSTRLDMGTSDDPEWERGKLVKDRSDILALIDPAAGGRDLGVTFLGHSLARYPFLVPVFRQVGMDTNAVQRYGRLPRGGARLLVENTIRLLT